MVLSGVQRVKFQEYLIKFVLQMVAHTITMKQVKNPRGHVRYTGLHRHLLLHLLTMMSPELQPPKRQRFTILLSIATYLFKSQCLLHQDMPRSVYVPWKKPGSDLEEKLSEFEQNVGDKATNLLKKLQDRHWPCSLKSHPNQPSSIAWEESWSSTNIGTRDPNGEVLIHQLGQILRDSNQRFVDPYFPADVSSLFVDPSQAEKNKAAASTERFDQDAFLAGKDVQRDVVWHKVDDIGNPREKAVVWSHTRFDVRAFQRMLSVEASFTLTGIDVPSGEDRRALLSLLLTTAACGIQACGTPASCGVCGRPLVLDVAQMA